MFAIGCLFFIVLPLIGMFIGGVLHGLAGAVWGAAIGFALACVLGGGSVYALVKASRASRRGS
ncbi:hypothetical protein [Novosphingobium rosa]|uniref:hypothetical protein n=1 Tax=Novosphingobium rosa TaxID=76978 RepID=UPI00082CC7C2|nr:hypothetical protein [Novosphingobium rosa]